MCDFHTLAVFKLGEITIFTKPLIYILYFCLLSILLNSAFSTPAQAKRNIELTAGLPKPPFVITSSGENRGIQLDLINAAFAVEKQEVHFINVPLSRSFSSIDKWHSDGTITLPTTHKRAGVYLSLPYVHYQNVLITLTEENLTINELKDLTGKKVVAFQMAKKFLGKEYISAVNGALDYREMADQMKQIDMLFFKRADVLVVEVNIFNYFLLQHKGDKYNKNYTVHKLFTPVDYVAGFKYKEDRDQFNRGLAVIKANGTYQKILDKYHH